MRLKFTRYFLVTRQRPDRAWIELAWIEAVVAHPIETQIQNDGRIRKWGFVHEVGKYLRVILLEDGETVHNVFFDRNFEGNKP
uniref:Uncharacterized protein n=1 Tax=Candidatus Kentrum eta TaxID=2126337 RepID=A0A450US44_9GAMM|nr:MAG: hypothetical protein BECKH772A_GA0070896_1007124 [Candidatus Kentron sp. H]VFJ95286.1 MAG: hypothetical protein BECKH772B_GA0070898_1007424 [Candidatus Kentron sp. H]VFK01694.1 MAG: hypothetical protein BECKH772C_GA0070978_1007024 [Candidatus Kentron sp. H]